MAGMLQILTYLMGFYLIVKGFEVLQIGLCSNREKRAGPIIFGVLVLIVCVVMAFVFAITQDQQAISLSW